MINIVIPMAGRGSRFVNAGYRLPKPLIPIHGHAMIEYVIKNLSSSRRQRFLFLCLKEHLDRYNLKADLEKLAPGCVVIPVDHVTEGAACTVLLAQEYIDSSEPLLIANSDQYVEIEMDDFLDMAEKGSDGFIMTMTADDPKWSFIGYDGEKHVTVVREKEVISDEATVGIYYYRSGSGYVRYAKQMIGKNIRVNGEFYVAPVYNEMIADGREVGFWNIGAAMHGLGTPEDLTLFEKKAISGEVFCTANEKEVSE